AAKSCSSSAASAARPSTAVWTVYPASRSTSARLSRTPGSSSAIRMASAIGAGCYPTEFGAANQTRSTRPDGACRSGAPARTPRPGRRPAIACWTYDEHGNGRMADDLLGDAADDEVGESRPAHRRHHDRVDGCRGVDDAPERVADLDPAFDARGILSDRRSDD